MKTLIESLLDDNIINNFDMNFWNSKNSSEYKNKAKMFFNLIKKYPYKTNPKKYESVSYKDLMKDVWYIQISYTSVAEAFTFFNISEQYEYRVQYWNTMSIRRLTFDKNELKNASSIYILPSDLDFIIKEIINSANIRESLLDDEEDSIKNLDKALFTKRLTDPYILAKQYDQIWRDIIKTIDSKPIKDYKKIIKDTNNNYLFLYKGGLYSGDYITQAYVYKPGQVYSLVREFARGHKGGFLEYNVMSDEIQNLINSSDEIYKMPEYLNWLFEIKK